MFYVYTYADPRPTKNKQIVYVGKGQGDRAWYHWEKRTSNRGFGNFLAELRRCGLEPIIIIVKQELDEEAAFLEESRLIALYGRRDLKTGTLFNLTEGGEGLAGAVRTEEWCKHMSAAHSTPDKKQRYSAAQKARWENPAHRAKTVAAIQKAVHDPEIAARREAAKAVSHTTPEFKQTMSKATTAMWQDEEYRKAVTEAQVFAQNLPERQEARSKASKQNWAKSPEKLASAIKSARSTDTSKAKTSKQAKAQWADPEYAAMQTANNKEIANRADVKAAKAAALKARWADPEFKAMMLAARRKNVDTKK